MVQTGSMAELLPGEKGIVEKLCNENSIKRRLQDIGLVKGTVVECVGISPLGDPTAYLIRGAVIAIRNEDSSLVKIKAEGN